jgi:hypothetical protein
MSLRYGLQTPRDLLGKLQRERARLQTEVTSDDFFNFVVTCYHLIDWIKNDPSIPNDSKEAVKRAYSNTYIAASRDLANASKHFTLRPGRSPRVVADATSERGYGLGRYGAGPFGIGEESIMIVLIDGTSYPILDFVDGALAYWEQFFTEHRL